MKSSHSALGLVQLMERVAPRRGENRSGFPGLTFYRVEEPMLRSPVLYQPCVCIVAAGSKRAFLGRKTYDYNPFQYLVLTVPLPLEAEIPKASPEDPFLSLVLEIDVNLVSKMLLELGDAGPPSRRDMPAQSGIFVSEMTSNLLDATERLVESQSDAQSRALLAPLFSKEMHFRILQGEQGHLLRSMALSDTRSYQIGQVLRLLHESYAEPHDIAALARVAGMSPSALHHHFKQVTSVSPLQYLKQIRLHKARLKMLHDGLAAGEAAFQVGYDSPSQFSREYRRQFGAPPRAEIERFREELRG